MRALTTREREIARFVGLGYSNRAIAGTLQLAECTVKNHLQRTFKKLRIENRTQLALWVREAT